MQRTQKIDSLTKMTLKNRLWMSKLFPFEKMTQKWDKDLHGRQELIHVVENQKKYNKGFKKRFMGGIFIVNTQIFFHGVKGRYKNKIGSSKLGKNMKNALLVFPFYDAFIK